MSLRVFGPSRDKALADLSDAELEAEAERRRRRRRGRGDVPVPNRTASRREGGLDRATMKRYLKSLELESGATLDEVRDAYLALLDKYDPDKHSGDPEKYDAAKRVTDSLTEAYRALREHLKRD